MQLVGLTITSSMNTKEILNEQYITAKGFVYVLNDKSEMLDNEALLNQFDAITKQQSLMGIPVLVFQPDSSEETFTEVLNLLGIVPSKRVKVFKYNT